MDLVTKNLLSTFRAQEAFAESTDDPALFEHFANYCVVSRSTPMNSMSRTFTSAEETTCN